MLAIRRRCIGRSDRARLSGAGARPGCRSDRRGAGANRLLQRGNRSQQFRNRRLSAKPQRPPPIITSAIEHSSILKPLERTEADGLEMIGSRVTGRGGLIRPQSSRSLTQTTALVTLGLANSEVGTIQDLAPLAAPIRSAGALFHIDAAQAVGRMRVDVAELGCDLMTVSGHKLGAPAGIGALFVRDPSTLAPMIRGGPQERGLRAGTPNLIGAVGFGAAAIARERLVKGILDDGELRLLLLGA